MPKVGDALGRLYPPLTPGFGQRVADAVEKVGGRVKAGEAMGMSDDQVGKIINENAVPNFAAIAALSQTARIPLEWLAFARGPASRDEMSTETNISGAEGVGRDTSDVIYLRGYGVGGVGDRVVSFPFPRRHLEEVLRVTAEHVAVLEHSGDAMEPTIRDRDLVLLDLRRREISDGAVLALRIGGELMVKRVQREQDGSVVLLSDNTRYGPLKMLANAVARIDVIGRMIWKGGPV